MSDIEFTQLAYVTRLGSPETRYFEIVSEWEAKRKILQVQLADIPVLLKAHRERKSEPYPNNPRISLVDFTPTIRLANVCEATANGLYSTAEIAANFAHKASKGLLPESFNALRKKCEKDPSLDIARRLGDLQWYRKVRELRTEWTHFSSIFIADDKDGSTILCVKAYRRSSDKKEFQNPNFSCKVDEFIQWVRNAMTTLDSFAGFLLSTFVLPNLPLDNIFTDALTDENGFPIILENGRFSVRQISIRDYLRNGGIEVA